MLDTEPTHSRKPQTSRKSLDFQFAERNRSQKAASPNRLSKSQSVVHTTNPEDANDKELNKAIRHLFKPTEYRQLTPEALEACQTLGVNPESLLPRSQESFNTGMGEAPEIVKVRHTHYMIKRKSKSFDCN